MAESRVYHRHRFLCRAICQELAGETVSLKEVIQARQRRKRALYQQIERRQSLVDQLIVSSIPTSPSAVLAPTPPTAHPGRRTLKRYENE
jgi:putative transposase